jgi:hypothetical protein
MRRAAFARAERRATAPLLALIRRRLATALSVSGALEDPHRDPATTPQLVA